MNKDTVCAIIVTYNSGCDVIDNIRKISTLVEKTIIIDNDSNSELQNNLLHLSLEISTIHVQELNKNIGLSKAQNIAIKIAISDGFDWVLMLDDDSKLSDDYISRMLDFYHTQKNNNIGIIVPAIKDINSSDYSKFIINTIPIHREKPNDYVIYPLVAISSGMLIRKDVFDDIGLMNEDFFIDYIDIEFSLRVNEKFKIAYCPNVILYHELGKKKKCKFLFFDIVTYNHSSFRRFYIYRNRIKVWRLFFNKYPSYISYEIIVSIVEFFKIILFEQDKKANFKAIINGIISGFKKKVGL